MSSSCSQVYPWSSWLERIAAAAEDKRRDVLTGQTGGSLRKSFGLVYPDELQAEGNIKYLEKLLSSLFPKKKVPVLSNTSPSWMTASSLQLQQPQPSPLAVPPRRSCLEFRAACADIDVLSS